MKVDSALGVAQAGLERAYRGIREEAGHISRTHGPSDTPDLARHFVGLMEQRQQFEAAARVVETVDTVLSALFPEKDSI